MASFFSVIRYVPDPILDERMNVGVVVYDRKTVLCRFIDNWQRARTFGDEDIWFLRDFASRFQKDASPNMVTGIDPYDIQLDGDIITQMAGEWINSIQLTEPRASTLSVDALLAQVSAQFLKSSNRRPKSFRDRQDAVHLATKNIEDILVSNFGPVGPSLMSTKVDVKGALMSHRFDISIGEKKPRALVQALSFEGPDEAKIERDLRATCWAVDDIKKRSGDMNLAIIAYRTAKKHPMLSTAKRVLKNLDASLVLEDDIEPWIKMVARPMLKAANQ